MSAATCGSGSGHGCGTTDTTSSSLRPARGKMTRREEGRSAIMLNTRSQSQCATRSTLRLPGISHQGLPCAQNSRLGQHGARQRYARRMRRLGDGSAGQPGGRSGDLGAPGGTRHRGEAGTGTGQGSDQSLFGPGYRSQRPGRRPGHQPAAAGTPGAGRPGASWPGAGADATVGKGPVRGYPPAPGQPPPLYPPGQFAVWNRMSAAGAPRTGPQPAIAADTGRGTGVRDEPDAAGRSGPPWYGQSEPGGPVYEPGYSALAVSDPAADVTSTQTWQAIGDGPDGSGAGAWTSPRGRAAAAGGGAPASSSADASSPDASSADPGSADSGSPATSSLGTGWPETSAPDL